MTIDEIIGSEEVRGRLFPVVRERVFFAHAGVAPLPRVAVDAVTEFCARGSRHAQENAWANGQILVARQTAARLLGCSAEEISLLGPTALGLNIVAHGIPWEEGDEAVYYPDDYPANVYPWTDLRRRGVKPVALRPEFPGAITWEVVEAALSSSTRLVTLATANFLSGFRPDVNNIGQRLRERGILFCLDGIQTLGAFPLNVSHVDFLSADSHKWMLGPAGAGILYVNKSRAGMLRPSVLGSWNVCSPDFVAQEDIAFETTGRRYEPGTLNLPGSIGMAASLKLLLDVGVEAVGRGVLHLRRALVERLRPLGFHEYLEAFEDGAQASDLNRSGILTMRHPGRDMPALAKHLASKHITVSCRSNRQGEAFLRFSPHFYNTEEEIDRIVDALG